MSWSHGDRSVVVEVDPSVAYAYLLEEGTVVADVWLCNITPPGPVPGWKVEGNVPPFQNPAAFCTVETRAFDVADLRVAWEGGAATIWHEDAVLARLWAGARPGQSRFAARRSPVAEVLG